MDELGVGSDLVTHFSTLIGLDIGSTTVKAALLQKRDGQWAVVATSFAPTTVERPHEDVSTGVKDAIAGLQALSGRMLLKEGLPVFAPGADFGCDAMVAASSAGGGCQMVVMGVMKDLTGESAQRAALGGGALVLDVIAVDDGRTVAERISLLRDLMPDALLVSGGTDGGNVSHVVALGEILRAAAPTPRFAVGTKTPVIYAGNSDAKGQFLETCGQTVDVRFVDNIRPSMDREVPGPAREEIRRVFLEHVKHQAPGYSEIDRWAGGFIRSTPTAIGLVLEKFAASHKINVLAVDVGGATTDVFSVMDGVFNRTVSAGTGVGYAMGWGKGIDFEGMASWVAVDVPSGRFKNWVANKMINPNTIPETVEELILEHSLARYAINAALQDHHRLAVELKGVQKRRGIGDVFDQVRTGQRRVVLPQVDVVIGTGGPLVHAPRPEQALAMIMDGIQPEGVTELYLDRKALMPVAGLLEEVEDGQGLALLEANLLPLGTTLCPSFQRVHSDVVVRGTIALPGQGVAPLNIKAGDVFTIPLKDGDIADIQLRPLRGVDVGAGPGRLVRTKVEGGLFGIIVDARGRPLDGKSRRQALYELLKAMRAYPGVDGAGMDEKPARQANAEGGGTA
jgi:hypothetical protein